MRFHAFWFRFAVTFGKLMASLFEQSMLSFSKTKLWKTALWFERPLVIASIPVLVGLPWHDHELLLDEQGTTQALLLGRPSYFEL